MIMMIMVVMMMMTTTVVAMMMEGKKIPGSFGIEVVDTTRYKQVIGNINMRLYVF